MAFQQTTSFNFSKRTREQTFSVRENRTPTLILQDCISPFAASLPATSPKPTDSGRLKVSVNFKRLITAQTMPLGAKQTHTASQQTFLNYIRTLSSFGRESVIFYDRPIRGSVSKTHSWHVSPSAQTGRR